MAAGGISFVLGVAKPTGSYLSRWYAGKPIALPTDEHQLLRTPERRSGFIGSTFILVIVNESIGTEGHYCLAIPLALRAVLTSHRSMLLPVAFRRAADKGLLITAAWWRFNGSRFFSVHTRQYVAIFFRPSHRLPLSVQYQRGREIYAELRFGVVTK